MIRSINQSISSINQLIRSIYQSIDQIRFAEPCRRRQSRPRPASSSRSSRRACAAPSADRIIKSSDIESDQITRLSDVERDDDRLLVFFLLLFLLLLLRVLHLQRADRLIDRLIISFKSINHITFSLESALSFGSDSSLGSEPLCCSSCSATGTECLRRNHRLNWENYGRITVFAVFSLRQRIERALCSSCSCRAFSSSPRRFPSSRASPEI